MQKCRPNGGLLQRISGGCAREAGLACGALGYFLGKCFVKLLRLRAQGRICGAALWGRYGF